MKTRGGVIVLMTMLAVVCADAQVEDRKIDLGFKGGITVPNMAIDPETDPGPEKLMGFGLGVMLGYALSPRLSVDTDFLYVQRGASYKQESEAGCSPQESDTRLTYLVISPLLRFKIRGAGLSPYFLAGPELGFLMSARSEGSWECQGREEGWEDDVKDYYKDTDFGLAFGAGLEFPSGNSAFFFEGRYYLGLTETNEPDGNEEDTGSVCGLNLEVDSVKNRGLGLFGGIRLK